MFKPAEASEADAAAPMTREELEAAERSMTDKERAIGLVTAPVAAAIAFLVYDRLINDNPLAHLKGGKLNPHHVNPTVYHTLELVMLALALVVLFSSMMRKRLYAGIASALFGLALFNMHYWGFAVPFVMVGGWLIARAYRLSQDTKLAASGGVPPRRTSAAPGRSNARVGATSSNPHRRKAASRSRR
jgi:hypothetical protein